MEPKPIKIALAGNPNSGKTTLFNKLTGSRQRIGNWPGVTIEKKEGTVKGLRHVTVQDLPGIYSLSPYTPEEEISRNYLLDEKPDVILNIVDSSNLERNLYLTTQLLELEIPVVVALNFIDVARRDGDKIDSRKLESRLGCPVIETSALKGEGVEECVARCVRMVESEDKQDLAGKTATRFSADVEQAIADIGSVIGDSVQERRRWIAVKAFERDEKALAGISLTASQKDMIETIIRRTEEKFDDDSESIITAQRYTAIGKLTDNVIARAQRKDNLTRSDRIDRVVTHRFWAYPIFIAVMAALYYIAISLGINTQDMVDGWFGDGLIPLVQGWMEGLGASGWLTGLVTDGIIGGVGAVLSFVPQMIILFVLLGIMEDIGYMARIAFILDRLFRRFGLSGKSFIPMLIGTGCSVPGIMASRTIESQRDRRMTIINTPMIPCGAKLPIIALVAGAVFGGAWWVAPLAYFLGLLAVIVSGIILKKTKMFQGDPSPFVMELPAYHIPSVGNVARSTWERSWSFIKRAGTVILLSSVVLWFLLHFAVIDGSLVMIEDEMIADSIAAKVGAVLGHLFAPLGFGGWQASLATVTGLIAKEEVISTFGVIFRIEDALGIIEEGQYAGVGAIAQHFTQLSAFSFMLFNLFCPPCFAAMGAIKREMNSAKWTWFAIGYLFVFAYILSFIVYQIGLLFTGGGSFNLLSGLAIALLAGSLYLLFRKPRVGVFVSA
jgi:ferrous iron transport protein B